MGKLHEVVAVADDNRGLYDKIVAETRQTFTARHDHFKGLIKTYQSEDASKDFVRDTEVKVLVETVPKKLAYVEETMIRILDAEYQREATNCIAKADIIVTLRDGTTQVVAKDVPSTFLLQMEKKFSTLRNQVYNAIPTLEPEKEWKWDSTNGYYVNTDPRARVTRRELVKHVKFEPTKEHQGQADLIPVDITAGYNCQVNQSGMTTPLKKSQLLDKIDMLIHAIKTARVRANEADAVNTKIAQQLFNFIGTADVLKEGSEK
jgi:hypothetical protein